MNEIHLIHDRRWDSFVMDICITKKFRESENEPLKFMCMYNFIEDN